MGLLHRQEEDEGCNLYGYQASSSSWLSLGWTSVSPASHLSARVCEARRVWEGKSVENWNPNAFQIIGCLGRTARPPPGAGQGRLGAQVFRVGCWLHVDLLQNQHPASQLRGSFKGTELPGAPPGAAWGRPDPHPVPEPCPPEGFPVINFHAVAPRFYGLHSLGLESLGFSTWL